MTFADSQADRDRTILKRFGASVSYVPVGAGGKTITAIFDEPSRPSNVGVRSAESHEPMLTVHVEDVPKPRKDDTVTIGDRRFRVLSHGNRTGHLIALPLEDLS